MSKFTGENYKVESNPNYNMKFTLDFMEVILDIVVSVNPNSKTVDFEGRFEGIETDDSSEFFLVSPFNENVDQELCKALENKFIEVGTVLIRENELDINNLSFTYNIKGSLKPLH